MSASLGTQLDAALDVYRTPGVSLNRAEVALGSALRKGQPDSFQIDFGEFARHPLSVLEFLRWLAVRKG